MMINLEECEKALKQMCKRCINHEICQGTGCTPRKILSDLILAEIKDECEVEYD